MVRRGFSTLKEAKSEQNPGNGWKGSLLEGASPLSGGLSGGAQYCER